MIKLSGLLMLMLCALPTGTAHADVYIPQIQVLDAKGHTIMEGSIPPNMAAIAVRRHTQAPSPVVGSKELCNAWIEQIGSQATAMVHLHGWRYRMTCRRVRR